MDGQLHQHALAEIAHRGHKQRAALETGVGHDFRDVFVLQAQGIGLEQGGFASLKVLDHGAAPTGEATDRGQGHREVGGDQPRVNEGAQQGDGAGGVATGVGHTLGLNHGLALARDQFGEAVDPTWGHAVRCGGVDDFGSLASKAVDHGDRFTGVVVVQTQDDQIDLRHDLALGLGVFAAVGRDGHQLDVGHALEAFADLQAGRAGFAVDEYVVHGGRSCQVKFRNGTL